MCTVLAKTATAIRFIHITASRTALGQSRCVSTNSAIERGIRKSKIRASGADYKSSNLRGGRYGQEKSETIYNRAGSAGVRKYNAGRENEPTYPSRGWVRAGGSGVGPDKKTRRVSYQRRQDAGHIEQPKRSKDIGRTSGQDNYQREGRKDFQAVRRGAYSESHYSDQSRRIHQKPISNGGKARRPYDSQDRRFERAEMPRKDPLQDSVSKQQWSLNNDSSSLAYHNHEQKRVTRFGQSAELSAKVFGANGSKPVPKWSAGDPRPRASDLDKFRERAEARFSKLDGDKDTEEANDRPEYTISRPTDFDTMKRTKIPLSVPYTTPASEFLYGTSVVIAALKSPRRKLYKLYIYQGEHRQAQNLDSAVKKLALAQGLKVETVDTDNLPLLDKMSGGRPHNGYILEASPLPKLPATSLRPVNGRNRPLEIAIDHQSREDELINGTDPIIKYKTEFRRYPFILMLDGILDPGNLGAILRTAHFLSVDAVAISQRHSAPLTPIALKASAGASEILPLISVPHPGEFVNLSQQAGWKFYAAVAPPAALPSDYALKGKSKKKDEKKASIGRTLPLHYDLSQLAASSPLNSAPCVLMLGSEGEGLRERLVSKADGTITIKGGWRLEGEGGAMVDSLNVGVAAGLLCEGFLRRPINERVGVGELSKDGRNKRDVVEAEAADEALGFWESSA